MTMPIYDYHCDRCDKDFEVFWTSLDIEEGKDKEPTLCECGVPARKVPSLVANTPDKWHGGWRK